MEPQQIRVPPNLIAKKVSEVRTIDFRKAYQLCVTELSKDKLTTVELKQWLFNNNVKLDPHNFLQTMYKCQTNSKIR